MSPRRVSSSEVADWSVVFLAHHFDVPESEIDHETRFTSLGMDSANSVQFVLALEDWLGVELQPELLGEFPTISALADYLGS